MPIHKRTHRQDPFGLHLCANSLLGRAPCRALRNHRPRLQAAHRAAAGAARDAPDGRRSAGGLVSAAGRRRGLAVAARVRGGVSPGGELDPCAVPSRMGVDRLGGGAPRRDGQRRGRAHYHPAGVSAEPDSAQRGEEIQSGRRRGVSCRRARQAAH